MCDAVVEEPPVVAVVKPTSHEALVDAAREKLTKYLGRAVEIITELAETSENDRVRLAAAESIADRAGLGKSSTQQVNVSASEHEAADREAQELVDRLNAQITHVPTPVEPTLESLIIHEGEPTTESV